MNLSSKERTLIQSILRRFFKGNSVNFYLFGSRAAGKARSESDLDILIKQKHAVPFEKMALLKEAFEESVLPFKVDVADYHGISEDFRQKILKDLKPI